MQWCEINGRKYHVVGGRVSHAVVNPTFDPIAKAGAMHDYFRGNPDGKQPCEFLREREPIPAEYRDRDARIAKLDEFGLESIWLFPTLGVLYEELLGDDVFAINADVHRVQPLARRRLGLRVPGPDLRRALHLALPISTGRSASSSGRSTAARASIVMRPAAPRTADGPASRERPAQRSVLGARAGSRHHRRRARGRQRLLEQRLRARRLRGRVQRHGGWRPNVKSLHIERAAHDFLITLVFDKLFERFPGVRVASVENGADFLRDLFKKLTSTAHKMPGYFTEDPVETFRRNVWINPFWEDDVHEVVELMGADRVIFGSDWPHIEGMPRPLDYAAELKAFDDDDAAQDPARQRPRAEHASSRLTDRDDGRHRDHRLARDRGRHARARDRDVLGDAFGEPVGADRGARARPQPAAGAHPRARVGRRRAGHVLRRDRAAPRRVRDGRRTRRQPLLRRAAPQRRRRDRRADVVAGRSRSRHAASTLVDPGASHSRRQVRRHYDTFVAPAAEPLRTGR